MGRLMRLAGVVVSAAALILVGIEVGMFIHLNDTWVTLRWPVPWASGSPLEYESPTWLLCVGWIVAAVMVATTIMLLPLYLTRRRHQRAELARLEREVAELRNLPINAPAPLEDLPRDPVIGAEANSRSSEASRRSWAPGELEPIISADD